MSDDTKLFMKLTISGVDLGESKEALDYDSP